MVEESTAASHSLSQEMSELAKMVEQFRVGDPAEAQMRRNLKATAPHAFARPAPAVAGGGESPRFTSRASKVAAAKSVAKGDWTEF